MIFGYCRVSTETQKIERQIENILTLVPSAKIFQEKFTGTTLERTEWQKLKKQVKAGDKIIFDSVSRMSRNSDEGAKEYFELMEKGVELEFIKEPYINTQTYQEQLKINDNIQINDNDLNETLIQGLREYLKRLAKKQIQIAFDQAEKEVQDLHNKIDIETEASKQLSKELNAEKQKVVDLTTKLEILEKESVKNEEEIKKLKEELAKATSKIEELQNKLNSKNEEITNLENSLKEKDGLIKELETIVDNRDRFIEDIYSNWGKEVTDLKKDIANLKEVINEKNEQSQQKRKREGEYHVEHGNAVYVLQKV